MDRRQKPFVCPVCGGRATVTPDNRVGVVGPEALCGNPGAPREGQND